MLVSNPPTPGKPTLVGIARVEPDAFGPIRLQGSPMCQPVASKFGGRQRLRRVPLLGRRGLWSLVQEGWRLKGVSLRQMIECL